MAARAQPPGGIVSATEDSHSLLVDASIYVFRAWFTLPDSILDAEGEPANAVYGFTDFVVRLLTHTQAERVAFAFDESLTSSFRNAIYPAYKANRETAPESLKRQFRQCRAFLRAAGLAELGSSEYEADDLIGALAHRERSDGRGVAIVTGDKDLAQLVGERDLWWEFAKDKRLDASGIERHFGVCPEQIADQLAIAGDKIDNIPGVPGIGMATAAKLLRRFGDLQTLWAELPAVESMQIRGAARIRRLLEAHRETVELARRLTGIDHSAPLPEDLCLTRGRPQALEERFEALAFGEPRRARWRALLGPDD
jgi:5'-3' exonuclease